MTTQDPSSTAAATIANLSLSEVLNKFHLSLLDSSVLFCQSCSSILKRENIKCHFQKRHNALASKSEYSLLMHHTLNQSGSCYVKLAQGTSPVAFNVEKFATIDEIPVYSGFRCKQCNFGDTSISSLLTRHGKYQQGRCNGSREISFEESRVQSIRIGSKHVGFGVTEEILSMADGSAIITEAEYLSARQVVVTLDRGRRSGIDSIESQLYKSLGWFRKNSDGTDFLDFSLAVLQRANSFTFPETLPQRLLTFFEGRISAVFECPADFRLLLSDEKSMTIRPILDQQNAYAKYFVEIFRIVCGLISAGIQNIAPEDVLLQLQAFVQSLLQHEGEYSFSDVSNLWGLLVDQPINLIGSDLLKTVIRFKCYNQGTGQLSKSSAVEQMSAKSFYFCRLYKLNCILNSDAECFPGCVQSVQDYFKCNDTPFHRLCYLKGLAGDIAESEDVSPIISSSHDPRYFSIDGIDMSPQYLNILYLGLVDNFKNHLQQLQLGFDLNLAALAIIDNHTDTRPGIGMRAADETIECFLLGQLFRENGPVRSRFFPHNSTSLNRVEGNRYISLFDRSCRILCALIHISSGMPARATEMCDYRLVNGTSLRNIYFVDGQIMIVSRYNKINALTGRNNVILRFLPESISKHVAAWITIIRPVYGFFIGELYGNERQSSALKYCFVKEGCCFTSQQVRDCFEEATLNYPGRELHFSKYRHVVKHFVKNVLNIGSRYVNSDDGGDVIQDSDGIEDSQFGHSSRTSDAVYGRNQNENLTRGYIMKDFREMSKVWQEFLMGGRGVSQRFDNGMGVQGTSMITSIRMDRESSFREYRESHYSSMASISEPLEGSGINQNTLVITSDFMKVKALMTSATGFTEFKSQEQRLCLALSCFCNVDILGIIPTGGGKSLIFFLYAVMRRSKHQKTLVIVPTKSLQNQFILDSSSFNLRASSSLSVAINVDIVFITPEAFSTNSCQREIYGLIANNSLDRIFVDEAHMIISDAGFRIDFENLKSLKYFNVSLTFLTGSLSPKFEKELILKFQRSDRIFKTIRCSSNRKNLVFKVLKKGEINDLDLILGNFFDSSSINAESRVIIYVHSIVNLDRIINLSMFKDRMASHCSERQDIQNIQSKVMWSSGVKPVMVATSGFGVGIDYQLVHLVACFGKPYTIEDMYQQFGRAGRDGRRSEVILMPLKSFENTNSSEDINQFIESKCICLRYFLTDIFDVCPVDCLSSDEMEKCDNCHTPITIQHQPSPNSGERMVFLPEGIPFIRNNEEIEKDLLRCLKIAQGKCLICLFERGTLTFSCSCSPNGRCFRCLKTGHGNNSPATIKCPEFKVKASCGVHYSCGTKFGTCNNQARCNFEKILPIFWRRKHYQKELEFTELGEEELKDLYIEFIEYLEGMEGM